MRIWAKIWKDGHMISDTTAEDLTDDTRTHKVFRLLDGVCREFDLAKPIWLDANVRDFQKHALTRFTKDSFVEDVDFDFLEFRVIDE